MCVAACSDVAMVGRRQRAATMDRRVHCHWHWPLPHKKTRPIASGEERMRGPRTIASLETATGTATKTPKTKRRGTATQNEREESQERPRPKGHWHWHWHCQRPIYENAKKHLQNVGRIIPKQTFGKTTTNTSASGEHSRSRALQKEVVLVLPDVCFWMNQRTFWSVFSHYHRSVSATALHC